MNYLKNTLQLFIILFSILCYSQNNEKDYLIGDFTYLLKAKINKHAPNYIYEELFSLKVSNTRAFFASTQSLKRDSVMDISKNIFKKGSANVVSFKGVSMPKTNYNYTIIQSNESIQYYELAGMSLLTYKEPVINAWKVSNEMKIINTFNCKKATLYYKGRNWIAWYSTEIPFMYGPYKFNGLPGLIIKITDEKGDYDFELLKSVSSSELKGKFINIKKSKYSDAIETSQIKLERALNDADANLASMLGSYGTTIIEGQDIIRQREKVRNESKNNENPIELIIK